MKFKKIILRIYKNIIFKFKTKLNLDTQVIYIKSLNELFNYFGTDKGTEVINPYQKKTTNPNQKLIGHGYAKFYETYLKIFKNEKISILEIGTWKGASVAAFYHYFKKAIIFCIDKNYKFKFKSDRVNFFNCDTENFNDVKNFENYLMKKKSEYFNIIIDDGSHKYHDILSNFKKFFKKIKPGGYYIIEDFNHYKLHPSYINDAPKKGLDIDVILDHLNRKEFFETDNFESQFQKYCIENISEIKSHKGIHDYSFIVFIKKK